MICTAGRYPVRYVWHEDTGFRAARIRYEAAKAAESDYLVFTDVDCIPHPHFVADHLGLAEAGHFVQGKRMLVGENASTSFAYSDWLGLLIHCFKSEVSGVHHVLRSQNIVCRSKRVTGTKTCNFALFKKDLVAVNGFNEDFVGWGREDSELVVRWCFIYGTMACLATGWNEIMIF
jgi:hypothetical protein